MEPLTELCDLVASNPSTFADKLAWICSRCPPPGSLLLIPPSSSTSSDNGDDGPAHPPPPPPHASRQQLHAILATARFLSKCPEPPPSVTAATTARSLVLEFLHSLPSSAFKPSFWPHSFHLPSISSFFLDLLSYLSSASISSPDLSLDLGPPFAQALLAALSPSDEPAIPRAFLHAVSRHCLPVLSHDGDRLVSRLLQLFDDPSPASSSSSSETTSALILLSGSNKIAAANSINSVVDDASSDASSRTSAAADGTHNSLDQQQLVSVDGGPKHTAPSTLFEEESLVDLERQEIAFKLFGQLLDKAGGSSKVTQVEHIRNVALKQIKSLPTFLKIRKRDWREHGAALKSRINLKLSTCQAAINLQSKILLSLDLDGKSTKDLLRRSLALLLEAAEACVLSSWRKLPLCEELFSTLLLGITNVTISRGGQLLRVLLIPLKPLVLTTCAQGDMSGNSPGAMFEAIAKISCEIIEFGWTKDRALVDTFIMGLAACIRDRNDHEDEDAKENQGVPVVQLNLIRLLSDLCVAVNKWEVVDMILPLFIESLEEGDASAPNKLRLCLLDAVSRMACLGFEKSYRETVVLMTRSYLDKIKALGNVESKTLPTEATTERVETLPAGFVLVASRLTISKLRSDYRHRLLSLCSDVGLAVESKTGRSGAEFLGPLLPAVAEICSDIDPTSYIEPSLLKLFRNLWFYVVLFGLAPPIQQNQQPAKSISTTLSSSGSLSAITLQAVSGPYMWHNQWPLAVQRVAQRTPPLVVSSVKWLEDELELNSLLNPGSRRGSGNEKAAVVQRAALSAALGGRVEATSMGTISGVKATYLLAVAFLEIIRFSFNGGLLNSAWSPTTHKSAFHCVYEYLRTPDLLPAVLQCLVAIVHKAFEAALAWLEEKISETGKEAELRESVLSCHACFLIESMSQREEHIRDISVNLLTELMDKFPQILWKSQCLDSLLLSLYKDLPSSHVNDPAWVASVRSLYKRIVRDWITGALSNAPCTTQGLLQEKICKLNDSQRTQQATDMISLLSDIRLCTGKNDCWTGIRTANIPAVVAAAAAASGGNLDVNESFNFEVHSTAVLTAAVKSNCAGEITGMIKLYDTLGGFQPGPLSPGFSAGGQDMKSGLSQPQPGSFNEILLSRFIQLLQQLVGVAEKGGQIDKTLFCQTCSQATVLLLSNMASESKLDVEGSSQLLRLLCWSPAYISTPEAMKTGIFIWTWLVSSAPQLGPLVLAELVDAWLWTIDMKRGLFASEMKYTGPAAKLRPHLTPGEPDSLPEMDPVEGIIAHRLWLGFFIDYFEVVRHESVEQLMLLGRLLQGTMRSPSHFSHHPAATGTFFTLMLFGLKFCSCQFHHNLHNCRVGLHLLEDRIYRASLGWFAWEPEWYETKSKSFAQSEAQSVSIFSQHLINDSSSIVVNDRSTENGPSNLTDQHHPVWGKMENYSTGREKLKHLLIVLCQHEADRLEVWAQPLNKETVSRSKISSEKWIEFVRTAFMVDPRIAILLTIRFPTISAVAAEVGQLVQLHILEVRTIPQALPFFVTSKAVDENSALLQQLPHWANCSIAQALEFLTPQYKGHPRVMAYVLRVMESYPPERVTFFMPQLVQALRYDEDKLVEGYLLGAAQRSNIFAHILIWHLQGETSDLENEAENKANSFQAILPTLRQKIIDGFSDEARDMFQREFDFFDKVTSISGVLFPLPKEDRRAGIRKELEKITINGDDLYLPTATNKLVRGIQLDSGIPLQSAAKVPIMITFNVADKNGDPDEIKPQACIFKVGDDCRQDVLALQVIALLRDVFEAVGLNLYLFPYGVLPTGPERGIIEVVPNSRSRNQMAETTDGGLYEIFQQDFGPVGSPSFEAAREMFIISSAGYAVASLLLQPKDRHNGNLLFDNLGRLVHIDFGFILETSPGGNMRFESAQFKLSHEMTQLIDPSRSRKSETWVQFVSLCVKGYLAARRYMHGIITTVILMVDSGLPCFGRGDPIGNLRKRFHPEMTEREAANFMMSICTDAYDKWTTAGYDLIQYLQQGIEK